MAKQAGFALEMLERMGRVGLQGTLKMVSLMISEWMAATPLTALLPTTARKAMLINLRHNGNPLSLRVLLGAGDMSSGGH